MQTVEFTPTRTFVGRELELARLAVLLDEVLAGRGGVALLAGEPGIGKTRLAEELSGLAHERGVRTLWGRCYEGEGAPALWPWLQILRELLRDISPGTLSRMSGAAAAPLAAIAPELRALMPDLPEPPPLEPAQARFRLFDSIIGFLREVATPPPVGSGRGEPERFDQAPAHLAARPQAGLLLIVDDLHWADASSLLLLDFLAAEIAHLPLLLIGAYRAVATQEDGPLDEMIARLARWPRSLHLTLNGLDADQVARLASTAVATPPPGLVSALARDTEGNPLFVIETMRLLAAEHRLTEAAASELWPGGMPPAIRGVIEQRLAGVTDSCRLVLTLAAVQGAYFDLDTLARVGGMTDEEVAEALDQAEIAAVIKPAVASLGRFQFTHSLLRQVLYDAIPRAQRAALHQKVGDALEQRLGRDIAGLSDDALAQLLYHFLQAAGQAGAAKALDYALACAERSERVHAHEESAHFYQRALQALARTAPTDARRRCELLLLLGEAQDRAGETEASKASFLGAAGLARSISWPGGLARAAAGFAGMAEAFAAPDDAAAALLEEALAATDADDDAVRARLLAHLVTALGSGQRRRRGAVLSGEAVEAARRAGDRAVLAHVLTVRHLALWGPHNLDERQGLATEAVRRAEQARDPGLQLQALRCLIPDAIERGDIASADRAIAEYARLAEELRQPSYQFQAAVFGAMRATVDGRYAEAERLAVQAHELGRRVQHPNTMHIFGVQIAAIRERQGRSSELVAPLRALSQVGGVVSGYNAALALMLLQTGRIEEARLEFERCARDDFHQTIEERFWLTATAILAQVCAGLGDIARARVLYQRLWPYRDHGVVSGWAANYLGAAARLLGLLAATIAAGEPAPHDAEHVAATAGDGAIPVPDRNTAMRHFEEAIAFDMGMGARPWVALARCDLAEFLLRTGGRSTALVHGYGPGSLLDAALVTAHELGMASLVERVRQLRLAHRLAPAPSPPTAAAARPGSLTEREVAVLRLLAAGATNKAIGAALYLSPNTVRQHTISIYRKIGAAGRAEATAWAARHGLLPQ